MLRVALAQFRPRKAAYAENLERIGDAIGAAGSSGDQPDLVVFPEAATTGYFVEGGVRELARTAEQLFADLAVQHRRVGAAPIDLVVGFYELWNTRLYNSALAATLGGPAHGIRHVHRKIFLPTYGVFDEERFVEPGRWMQAFDMSWGRAAVMVCEDAWHSIVPTMAALDGAQLLIVLCASPARGIQPAIDGDGRPQSAVRWERTAQAIAAEHGVFVALAHLVGFEGGKGFPGGSVLVDPRGEVVVRSPIFEDTLTTATVGLDEIVRARSDEPLLSDLETHLPHLLDALTARRETGRLPGPAPVVGAASAAPSPRQRPVGARAGDPLAIDPELTERWLSEFLRDEVERRRGFSRVVLGLSGGVDSAVVAHLAARTFGAANVTAVRMPYRSSSAASLEHAQLVIDQLGLASRTIDISEGVDGIARAIGGSGSPGRLGNVMARMRMITLFDLSAEIGAIPLGTGNKTERLFGYFTWHADDSPPVNPIGDLFKTQVWALARHLGVPSVIVDKAPTADLVAGQTDEGDFGISYGRADLILHWILSGYRDEAIVARGFTEAEVALVRRRVDSTHWKRRLPTVAMVSATAIGEFYLRPVDY
ncbi:MAG: NAD+ synthase [Gemmatimonadetes bacterium]|nr:NAD+ synthase [Gemmatimonadota bacterium]